MKNIFICLISLLLIVSCSRTQPLHNIQHSAIPSDLTIEQVQKAISKAVIVHPSWKIKSNEKGMMVAEVIVRTHTAEIEIAYNEEAYSITYINSTNLKYEIDKKQQINIHKSYNRWVHNLENRIEAELNTINL